MQEFRKNWPRNSLASYCVSMETWNLDEMVFVPGGSGRGDTTLEEVWQEYCLFILGRMMRYKCRGLVNQEFKIYDESN